MFSDCPALIVPASGSLSTDVVKVGTEVTVTCDQSYTLFGDVTIACETGGTWNTTVGTCRKGKEHTIWASSRENLSLGFP